MLLCITLSVVSVTETKQSPSVTQVKLSFVQRWQKHCNAVAPGSSAAAAAAASTRRSSRGRGAAAAASMVPPPPLVARPGPAAASPQQASPRPTSPAAAAASLRPFVTARGTRVHWLPGSRRPRLPAAASGRAGPSREPRLRDPRAANPQPRAPVSGHAPCSPGAEPPDRGPGGIGSRLPAPRGRVGAGSASPSTAEPLVPEGRVERWVCLCESLSEKGCGRSRLFSSNLL